jgi:hypothetical protein
VPKPRWRLLWIVVPALVAVAACGQGSTTPAATTLALEPVTSMGTNPFTPPVGTGQALTSMGRVNGTIPGNTAGLFGGTQQLSSCDPHKLVVFLQAHPDKAAAWAGVLGIAPANIAVFVSTLTSVVLRTDTVVINHGFVDGHATAFAAVLQAGTAVLVDKHGFPVTRCACGNPLTVPSVFTKVTFTGTPWPTFSSTSITIIQSSTVVINTFTLVEPHTGAAFQRPAGTHGADDSQPVAPPPSPGVTPTQPPPNATTPAPNPTTTVPPQSTAPAPQATTPPQSAAPVPQGTTTPPPTATPPPTTTAPHATHPPTTTPPAPPLVPPPPAQKTPPPPTSTPPAGASWVIGTCFVDRRTQPPTFTGTVKVRNDDKIRHSYQVTVTFGNAAPPVQADVVLSNVEPDQTVTSAVSAPGTSDVSEPTVPCEITRLVDETGKTPAEGPPIAPPHDTPPPDQPTPTTPAPPTPEVPTTPPETPPPPLTPPPVTPTLEPPTLETS